MYKQDNSILLEYFKPYSQTQINLLCYNSNFTVFTISVPNSIIHTRGNGSHTITQLLSVASEFKSSCGESPDIVHILTLQMANEKQQVIQPYQNSQDEQVHIEQKYNVLTTYSFLSGLTIGSELQQFFPLVSYHLTKLMETTMMNIVTRQCIDYTGDSVKCPKPVRPTFIVEGASVLREWTEGEIVRINSTLSDHENRIDYLVKKQPVMDQNIMDLERRVTELEKHKGAGDAWKEINTKIDKLTTQNGIINLSLTALKTDVGKININENATITLIENINKFLTYKAPPDTDVELDDVGFLVIQILIIIAFAICFVVLMLFAVWRQRYEGQNNADGAVI